MANSLRGQFLVAGPGLRDPNFFQAVVLMVEHSPEGAMGLVVNRPTDLLVSSVLSEHFDLPETTDLVYAGGPVSLEDIFLIHSFPDGDPDAPSVIPGLYLGSSAESFAEVVQSAAKGDKTAKFRVFQGYAGWGAKQLESEMARSDWLTCPASADVVFHEEPYAVWETVMERIRRSNPLGRVSDGRPDLN
jgi:putative transcriptional regulator